MIRQTVRVPARKTCDKCQLIFRNDIARMLRLSGASKLLVEISELLLWSKQGDFATI